MKTASDSYLAALFQRGPGGLWHRWDAEPSVPQSVAIGVKVPAYVNEGRWVVDCPFCPGAQLAHPKQDRFFCVDCLNEEVKGQWVTVVFPKNRDAIEQALDPRPAKNMNWFPGETVAQLLKENDANLPAPLPAPAVGDKKSKKDKT